MLMLVHTTNKLQLPPLQARRGRRDCPDFSGSSEGPFALAEAFEPIAVNCEYAK
jgi:hypothetical protein